MNGNKNFHISQPTLMDSVVHWTPFILNSFAWKCILGSQNANLKASYAKLSDKIEQITKLLYFVQIQISVPLNMLPPLLITLGNYYILDMQNESFVMPFPTMYVPTFQHSIACGFKLAVYSRTKLIVSDCHTNRCHR